MNQSAAIAEPGVTSADAPGSSQYVTFMCGGVEYGVDISQPGPPVTKVLDVQL